MSSVHSEERIASDYLYGKHFVKSRGGLRIQPDPDETSPFSLPEPSWMPDGKDRCCSKCQAEFNFRRRRHHCRRCGKIYCGTCANDHIILPRLGYVYAVRLCWDCSVLTRAENRFYTDYLKRLIKGASYSCDLLDTADMTHISLTENQRTLNLKVSGVLRERISIDSIQSLDLEVNSRGETVSGLLLLTVGDKGVRKVRLRFPSERSGDACRDWLVGLQKGLQMIQKTQASS